MNGKTRFALGERVTWIGLTANIALAIFKGLAGFIGRSQAVIADALESVSDIIATFLVLISLKVSRKPRDIEHPYGHYKIEPIIGAVIGIVIFLAGIGIFWVALRTILVGKKAPPGIIALWAAVITIIVKESLYYYTMRIGRRIDSASVKANAWDHRKDALTTIGTLVGVAGARLGFPLLDPIAALFVDIFIFRIGVMVAYSSFKELMDISPPREIIDKIRVIAEGVKGIEHVTDIKARKTGPYIVVDIKVDIDYLMTVAESHELAGTVKHVVLRQMPNIIDVMIHVNPHVRHE